jgi:hypothetical protein
VDFKSNSHLIRAKPLLGIFYLDFTTQCKLIIIVIFKLFDANTYLRILGRVRVLRYGIIINLSGVVNIYFTLTL